MVSISEDQTLPVDFNGTSLMMSGGMDSTLHDPSSLSNNSTDMETPGLHPTLNSVGGISPQRVRTMKDQELQWAELRKENFGLKLRIYHLEEALNTKWGERSEGWQLNIDLKVQMDDLKKELAEKDELILQARSGLKAMAAKHAQELNELRQAVKPTEDLHTLEEKLEDKEAELEEAQQQMEEANARAAEIEQANDQLEDDLKQKEKEMEDMHRALDEMRREIADQQGATASVPVPTQNVKVQTSEPMVGRREVENVQAQLDDAGARLREKEREIVVLRDEVEEKGGRVKQLEVELLTTNQRMASGAGVHARHMSEQAAQLDHCKADLREAEAELRRKGAEMREKEREAEERGREADEARRRARDAEDRANSLEPRARSAERESQDLRRQLRDAQAQSEEEAERRARDLRAAEERVREAEERLGRSRPEMAAREREIEEMARTLGQRDEEISQLRTRLDEKEREVVRSRQAAHAAGLDRQEQARAMEELRAEMADLRNQLHQKQASVQQSTEAALAAKDAIIRELEREVQNLRAKLAAADERLLQLSTSKAAEVGVMQGTVDDLNQQIRQLQDELGRLRDRVGQLEGENAALKREADRLRDQTRREREHMSAIEAELTTKTDQLEDANQAMAELSQLLEKVNKQQSSKERDAAEKAQLKAQVSTLRKALANREGETEKLKQALELQSRTIAELQEQLQRSEEEREREAERANELHREKSGLQDELTRLQSQERVAQLSAEDLQTRLTQVYREREEMARRLREAEDALGNKDTAYERARRACEALQKQVVQLQEQVRLLSQQPCTTSVGVATSSPEQQDSGMMAGGVDESMGAASASGVGGGVGGSQSTTMIFGSLSEDLLKTILQRLQEIYSEILTNRVSGKESSSTLAAKMEHVTDLQRHLEACFHDNQSTSGQDSKPASGNTSYTAYYFMRGDRESNEGEARENEEEEEVDVGGRGRGGRSTPRSSSTPKKHSPRSPPRVNLVTRGGATSSQSQSELIQALQSELEEVKRWNEALQTRLRESGGRRDVGVGMEKGGSPPQSTSLAQGKYRELEREVDRLLRELESERERSQMDREQQETETAALQGELSAARERVGELESELEEAITRDVGGISTAAAEAETLSGLGQEVEELREQLEKMKETMSRMKGQLLAERDDNNRLRSELTELQRRRRDSDHRGDATTTSNVATATASAPNLLTPERTPGKKMTSDSWTSPGTGTGVGLGREGRVDVQELKERHQEVTRLNLELQRKCREQLHKSPPSASSSSRMNKSREEEEGVEARLREAEVRAARREEEWREKEKVTRRQLVEMEQRLAQSNRDCEAIRTRLSEALATCREKDEERVNVTRSLSQVQERMRRLEREKEEVEVEKRETERELEEKLATSQRDLERVRQRAEQLENEAESRNQREEEEEEEEELKRNVDSLTHQLARTQEDLEKLQKHNSGLQEQKNVLNSQLSSCRGLVASLQTELRIYQKLSREMRQRGGGGEEGGEGGGRLLKLLEEVRRLREQLQRGVSNSDALAEQLHSKLDVHQSEQSEEMEEEEDEEEEVEEEEEEEVDEGVSEVDGEEEERESGGRRRRGGGGGGGRRPPFVTGYVKTRQAMTHETAIPPASGINPHLLTPRPTETRIPMGGGLGTLTVRADVKMTTSDTSTTTLPVPGGHTPRRDVPSFLLSAPRSHSSPYVVKEGGHKTSSHTHSSSERHHKGTGEEGGRGGGTPFFSEYLTREGIPKLEPAVHASYPPPSASPAAGEGVRPSGIASSSSAAHHSASSPATERRRRTREFESFEHRLKEALESSDLQNMDPAFLEGLLAYLRQQHGQLDESRRLLDNIEQQRWREEGGASGVAMETSQSGTIPSVSAAATGGGGGGGEREKGRKGKRDGVDLKSIYKHLVKTQESLLQAKSNLNTHKKPT